jgi:hypothetical protein
MDTPPHAALSLGPTLPLTPLLDPAAWAATTFRRAALGDARRTRRLVATATALATAPATSLPSALADPAALKATYRLLHEEAVTVETLTAPVRAQTLAAARIAPVVLLVQDTTELDYTHHPATSDLGPIGDGRGQGYLLQSVLAVAPATATTPRRLLGLAHLDPFLRVPAPRRGERCSERRQRSRESDAWARAATAIGAPPPGSRWIHVGDRGGDIFLFLTACRTDRVDFLVRAVQDRRATAADGSVTHLLTAARALPPVGSPRDLELPAQPGRPARTAALAITWTALTIQPPPDLRRTAEPIPVWVVRVWEPDPPVEVKGPLEWVLLSSVPVATASEAWERVAWYRDRWLVEEYHTCLKTGCRLETSQLRDKAALWRLLGVRAPLAVRLLTLREAVRTAPEQPAVAVMPAEVVAVVAAKTGQVAAGMTMRTCWRAIARLGGHQGRKHDGEPGWQTLWRGWLYVQTLLEGVHLARDLLDDRCG